MFKKIIVLALLTPCLFFAQHTIKGKFLPAKEYNLVLLYKVTPTLFEYIAEAEVKQDGSFEFKLDPTISQGVYRAVYAIPQEDYNFDIIYNKKEDIELIFNSETGVTFLKSSENRLMSSYTNSMSKITKSIGDYFKQANKDPNVLMSIFNTQRETQLKYEKTAEGTIALAFIKANTPYIPKKHEPVKTYINNLKLHYFDYVDFKNTTLQSSSFLQQRMLNYVFGITTDKQDESINYIKNIDVFYNVIKDVSYEVQRILLIDLWEQMKDLGFEKVANYISESYLIDVAVKLNDQELINELLILINTEKGQVAPDFSFKIEKDNQKTTKKLSELKLAKNYIILFWSSSCSDCLDEIALLQSFIQKQEKGFVKVIAVGLEDESKEWNSLIKTYSEFIHVCGLGKWENDIAISYGIKATPTYYILNTNKEIINKPSDFENLKAFFKNTGAK